MKQQLDQRDKKVDDRFLQCVPSKDPKKPKIIPLIEEKEKDERPFSCRFAKKIQNYFLLFFVVVLFILAYFVILYLHKTNGFQEILLVFLTAEQVRKVKSSGSMSWYECN